MTLRHASFFSGVGGLDLGFQRAGIATVSLSEIDPYASAVLAERFPEVPNLGDITKLNGEDIPNAEVWSGGFPCQDLSVAGKRKGFQDGTRSSLAFTYLDLVERRLPRWLVLENVPGLFSSNGGRDFARLIREMVELGYGLAWRTLDARFFGVPQRRRRVFIVAARDEAFGGLGAERAAEVLFECDGVCGHLTASREAREETTRSTSGDASGDRRGEGDDLIDPPPHSDGVRTANGLARGVDDREEVVSTPAYEEGYADSLNARDWKGGVSNQDIGRRGWLAIVREANFGGYAEDETGATMRSTGGNYGGGSKNLVAHTLTAPTGGGRRDRIPLALSFPSRFGSNAQVTEDVAQSFEHSSGAPAVMRASDAAEDMAEDELLPVGLDSHRYRCAGNGIVSNVAEWIGRRIVAVDRKYVSGAVAGYAVPEAPTQEAE